MQKSSQGKLDTSAYDSLEAAGRFHTLIRNISRLCNRYSGYDAEEGGHGERVCLGIRGSWSVWPKRRRPSAWVLGEDRTEVALKRERLGKRHRGIGRLRPNVVLYGEENPDGDTIGKIAERDLRTGPDVVIMVGTGLKVPGARRLVKEFYRSTKSRGGLAIWINKDPVPSGLKGCFDSTLQRDCDDVVSLLSLWTFLPLNEFGQLLKLLNGVSISY